MITTEIDVLTDGELEQEQEADLSRDFDALDQAIHRHVRYHDDEPDSCWIWIGSINKGRGVVSSGPYTNKLAYRVSFRLYRGRWPIGDCRHLCGNKLCVNPAHLADGGLSDNTLDTRFHNACAEHGFCAPFPLAPEDWGIDWDATGAELLTLWLERN